MAGRRHRVPPSVGYIINTSKERLSWKITLLLVVASILMSINIMFLVNSQPNTEDIIAISQSTRSKREMGVFARSARAVAGDYQDNGGDVDFRGGLFAQPLWDNQQDPLVFHEESLPDLSNETFVIIRADEAAAEQDSVASGRRADVPAFRPPKPKSRTNKKGRAGQPRKTGSSNSSRKLPVGISPPRVIGSVRKNTLPSIDPHSSVTPNEILLRTAVAIKTFNRPECCFRTVQSFRKHYPTMAIFVADDSIEDTLSMNLTQTFDVTYIRLGVDSGVGYGRNRLVEAIGRAGFQFLVMSDDDYTIEDPELLLEMADRYILTKADALGPKRCDFGHCERSLGMIHLSKSNQLTVFPNMTVYPDEPLAPACKRSDLLQQFFLAQTSILASPRGWDDHLKNNDHYDFLFTAKKSKMKLVSCFDIKVMHNKKKCQDMSTLIDSYLKVRAERWLHLVSHVFKKWKLSTLYDETGKEFRMVTNRTASGTHLIPVIKPSEKVVVTRSDPDYEYFVQAVLDDHNQKNAGWYSYREVPKSRKTYIVHKRLNPCLHWVGGKLATRFDRHSSFPNADKVHSFNFHHFNRSCSVAEDFWQVKSYGKGERRHVYYVTALSSDEVHMKRLLGFINNQTDKFHISLVVVDMGNSKEKFDMSQVKMTVPVYYVYLGAPFSRSIGLRRGFDFAKQIAAEKGHKYAIGFSVDTSIVMPDNFTEVIRESVRCGVSTFAPVCYKSKDPGGYWVTTGYGMVGACFEDYDGVGGWDTRWGYKWGAEDVDLMNRLQAKVPYTVRTLETGFFHQHSGASRKTHSDYYKNKNMYDKDLPITPLTDQITDPDLLRRITAFAVPRMRYPIKLTISRAYFTPAGPLNRRTLIDARFVNDKNEAYFALIESFF